MFSPRASSDEAASTTSPQATTPRGSLLGSLSKMLWSPSQADDTMPAADTSSPVNLAASSSFMTQSPRRGQSSDGNPGAEISSGRSDGAGSSYAEGSSSGDKARSGWVDTLFSPMFTLFGSKADGSAPLDPAAAAAAAAAAEEAARIQAAQQAAANAAAAAAAQAAAAAAATQPQQQQQQQADHDDEGEQEFDPYAFIRSLPPQPPPLTRPVCLPKKTRGTPPISLVLDLDETLLHSSIVPLPTYDIDFQVHFNNINYQVYVRKRPHMEYFMEQVSKIFEIIVFTASQKVYADKLLSIIDPQRKWIKHRVFRDSCVLIEGNYLKDLQVLGRDLTKTAIVDNSPQVRHRTVGMRTHTLRSCQQLSAAEELMIAHLHPLVGRLLASSWTTASPSSRGLRTRMIRSCSSCCLSSRRWPRRKTCDLAFDSSFGSMSSLQRPGTITADRARAGS